MAGRSPAFSQVLDELAKKHSEAKIYQATGVPDRRRISTGIFGVDRILGGGLPLNRITIICGQTGAYKTTFALKVVKNYLDSCLSCFLPMEICSCEKPKPNDLICIYIDSEHSLEEGYIRRLKIDHSRLYIFQPDYGELACEYAEKFAQVPEVGIIIQDSIAALTPQVELESGYMDSMSRALRAKLAARMSRAMISHLDSPTPKLAIFINHLLPYVSGQVQGEYLPGGKTPEYYSSVVLKLWKRENAKAKLTLEDEEELDDDKRKQGFGFLLQKSKVSKCNIAGEFELHTAPSEKEKIIYGDCDDYDTILHWGQKLGLIESEKNHHTWDGQNYPSNISLFRAWRANRPAYYQLQHQIIQETFHDQD